MWSLSPAYTSSERRKPSVSRNHCDRLPHLRRAEHAVPDALDRRRRLPEPHQHAGATQGLGARVHRLSRDGDGRQRLDAVDDLDLVAVRLLEPDPPAAAGLVEALHGGGPRRRRDPPEVVLAGSAVRERQEPGLPLLRHVEMMGGVRAAHVERARRPRRPDQAEVSEELLHDVQVGRPEPDIREILYLDQWHRRPMPGPSGAGRNRPARRDPTTAWGVGRMPVGTARAYRVHGHHPSHSPGAAWSSTTAGRAERWGTSRTRVGTLAGHERPADAGGGGRPSPVAGRAPGPCRSRVDRCGAAT